MFLNKYAFVSFFEVFPPLYGSSVVCSSFFKNWPHKNKKLFQLSQKQNLHKNICNIYYYKSSLGKLFALINLIYQIKKYLNGKKNFLIIEGASWSGYSYLLSIALRILIKDLFILYKTHSVEYEIRKNNNNIFIAEITRFFEKKMMQNSNLVTSVSRREQKVFASLYNAKTFLFHNTIDYNPIHIKNKNKNKKKYIIFSGSKDYKPNLYSINELINVIMPNVIKKLDINLYIFGNNNLNKKYPWLHIKKVSKKKYLTYLKNAFAMIVPSNESYGSKIKIIESLCYGVPIITTNIGFTGIDKISNIQPIIAKSSKDMVNKIFLLNKNYKKYLMHSIKIKSLYIKKHDIKKSIFNLLTQINKINGKLF